MMILYLLVLNLWMLNIVWVIRMDLSELWKLEPSAPEGSML